MNSGMELELITTVIVAVIAQELDVGVKIYVVVERLLAGGDHVPKIPFSDVFGNVKVAPSQIGLICAKVGVVEVFELVKVIEEFMEQPMLDVTETV
jgi:hypothetical protein